MILKKLISVVNWSTPLRVVDQSNTDLLIGSVGDIQEVLDNYGNYFVKDIKIVNQDSGGSYMLIKVKSRSTGGSS